MNAWAVKKPSGYLIMFTARETKEQSTGLFHEWEEMQKDGFTCVPVQIVEASQEAARQGGLTTGWTYEPNALETDRRTQIFGKLRDKEGRFISVIGDKAVHKMLADPAAAPERVPAGMVMVYPRSECRPSVRDSSPDIRYECCGVWNPCRMPNCLPEEVKP